MKKLSTTLKNNRTLNENAIDSRESFFRYGRNTIAFREGESYNEPSTDAVLNGIYDKHYPSFTNMLQDLSAMLMTPSQKDIKAREVVVEIFTDLINDPNVAGYYPKLAKALSYDASSTIECYVHNLAQIADNINTSDIDLIQYFSDTMTDVFNPSLLEVCTPLHAMEVVEQGLMLHSYILANVPRGTDVEGFRKFYSDVLAVYNDYKESYGYYREDIELAKGYFKSALAFRDPSFYLNGDKFNAQIPVVAQPLFIASFMNIFMTAYRNNQEQINRRVITDRLNRFENIYQEFLANYNVMMNDMFVVDRYDYSATRLKQYFQVGIQISGAIKDIAMRKRFIHYLDMAKEVCDALLIIEARQVGKSNIL